MRSLGPYEVLEELGRGASGAVLRGRDPRDGREVALKLLLEPLEGEGRQRILRELTLLRALDHRGIVRVLDHGLDGAGRPWLALELVSGGSLEDRVRTRGPLPDAAVRALGAELGEALAHAHARGLVHRDLKPGNVLLEADGRARLADFGLARRQGPVDATRLTETGAILGTPAYMAPEQARDARVGPAADVWALGATLYFALTGAPPFEAPSLFALLTLLLGPAPAPRPSARRPVIDPDLEAVVMRCLAKDPAARPDALEVARDLGRPTAPVARRWPHLLLGLGTILTAAAAGGLLAWSGSAPPAPPPPAPPPVKASPSDPGREQQVPLPREGLAEAQARLWRGDLSGAREALDELLRLAPDQAEALTVRAQVRAWQGDPPGCTADLERALALDPEHPPALALQAELLLQRDQPRAALEAVERALARAPSDPEARLTRAKALAVLNRPDEARDELEALLQPDSPARAVLARTPLLFQALTIRAQLRVRAGDWSGVEADARVVLESRPLDHDLRGLLCEALMRLGRAAEAERELTRILDADPDHPGALFARAELQRAAGDLEGGRATLERIVAAARDPHAVDLARSLLAEDGPERPQRLTAQARRRLGAGDEQGALGDVEAALRAAPDHVPALVTRGAIRARQGDVAGAREDLDRALELAPDSVEGLRTRGLLRRDQRDAAGAAVDLRRALELSPPDKRKQLAAELSLAAQRARMEAAPEEARELLERARALRQRGDDANALVALERAMELAPGWAELWTARAEMRRAGDDPQLALADVEHALELAPDLITALVLRSELRARAGERRLAAEDLRRALELLPPGASGTRQRLEANLAELERDPGR